MTEFEWSTCADPDRILEFIGSRATASQLRQFACACCRRIWPLFCDERSRRAILVAEIFSKGMASLEELQFAADEALEVADANGDGGQEAVAAAAAANPELNAVAAAFSAAWAKADAAGDAAQAGGIIADWNYQAFTQKEFQAERSEQADLLRKIFGNPIRDFTAPASDK